MMLVSPSLRLSIQDTLHQIRTTAYESCEVITPNLTNCTTCGYNAFTDSANTVPCATCNGTGKVVSSYTRQTVSARAEVVEIPILDPFRAIPPGVEGGDYIVWIGERDYDTFNTAWQTEHAYVLIRKQTFKIKSVTGEGVGHTDEYRIICCKYKPVFTAP